MFSHQVTAIGCYNLTNYGISALGYHPAFSIQTLTNLLSLQITVIPLIANRLCLDLDPILTCSVFSLYTLDKTVLKARVGF